MITVNLTIDGKVVDAQDGETLLNCALRHGIDIPHLCANEGLAPHGGCRMCLVEVEGMRGYPPSCTTPAAEGMVVATQTPALRTMRRNILGLMMLEHPNACLVCGKRELCEEFRPTAEKDGRTTGCHTCNNKAVCDVRTLAADLELTELPVAPIYHQRPLERDNPFLDRDLNLCILCGRCVRVCKEQQGDAVIDFVGRGSQTRIGQAFGQSLLEAGCTFCGACVDVCPTGTLSDRYAKWYGKPEAHADTTCAFCGEACALAVNTVDGQAISTRAVNPNWPLCVLGRFSVAEFLNGQRRLQAAFVRVGQVLRQTDSRQALEQACTRLDHFKGDRFAFVCDSTSTLEDRHVFRRFTTEIMQSPHYVELAPDVRGRAWTTLPEGVRAVIATGNFFEYETANPPELLVVMDIFPSPLSMHADFVFPSAVFAEVDGTITDRNGVPRPLRAACMPPGHAQPDWWAVTALSQALGGEGLPYKSAAEITRELDLENARLQVTRDSAPAPALDLTKRVVFYRGHRIEEQVAGLLELPPLDDCLAPLPMEERADVAAAYAGISGQPTPLGGKFKVLEKREIIPNTHEIVVEAPEIAQKAQAGQFVIVMADAVSERIPYTLCDWDKKRGSITLVIQEKGRSSRKMALLEPGDCLAHVTGPLGIPLDIQQYGTVMLNAGCYGIGAIVPIAKAMKAAGNKVITVAEARSYYMAYYGEKLAGIADEFVQTTIDGSHSEKGHAVDVLAKRLADGERMDLVICVGCPFMMMLTAKETLPYGVKTLAALNPIMVDGTGMCGACRITVGDQTKFACVDGPFFDAHLVDWTEVRDRRAAYSVEEIHSVGRSSSVTAARELHQHAGCSCKA